MYLSTLNLTPSTSIKLTGLDTTGWSTGKRVLLRNATSITGSDAALILLERNSSDSSASNRFQYVGNKRLPITLMPQETAELHFDGTDIKVVRTTRQTRLFKYFDLVWDGTNLFAPWTSGTGSGAFFNQGGNTGDGEGYVFAELTTGTTSTGAAWYVDADQTVFPGNGCLMGMAQVRVASTSDGTNSFDCYAGFTTAVNPPTNSICWLYDHNTSANWHTLCRNGGTSTLVDSGQAHSTTAVPILGTFVNGDASRADFFYSFDSGLTWAFTTSTTTNIPTTNGVGFGCSIIKSLGTTERFMRIRWMGRLGYIV